jgi:hypothetical protein
MARRIALSVWDFVVGDDWRAAVVVAAVLGATALISAAGLAAWWLAPPAVLVFLFLSVRRADDRPPRPSADP